MTTFAITKHRLALAVAALSAACGTAPDEVPGTASEAAALLHVPVYHHGPLLRNAEITVVFWNRSVDANITQFYAALTSSEYLQRLTEFSADSQTIGLGSLRGAYRLDHVDPTHPTNVSGPDIVAELTSQIAAGHLPMPNANTLYAVHLAPGSTLNGCVGGCCSDHLSDVVSIGAPVTLQYTRILDFAPGECCASNHDCGTNTPFQNMTSAASHEVAEAVTDPQPFTNPGWAGGDPLAPTEIADDECRNTFGTVTAVNRTPFTVQSYFSFLAGRCIVPCATATCTASGACTPGSGCTLRDQTPSFVDGVSALETPAASNGLIGPCAMDASGPRFCPSASITRGELATVIVRALFGDWFTYTAAPWFTDVAATDWRFRYIQKLRDLGFTQGTSATTYSPDLSATRRDAAVFVMRALAYLNSGNPENFTTCANPFFTDVPPSDGGYKYIQELRRLGITTGSSPTTYSPAIDATRETTAVFAELAFDPAHYANRSQANCP